MVAIAPDRFNLPDDHRARPLLKVTFMGRGEPEPVFFFVLPDRKTRKRARHLLDNYSHETKRTIPWMEKAMAVIDRHTVAFEHVVADDFTVSPAEIESILTTLATGEIKTGL